MVLTDCRVTIKTPRFKKERQSKQTSHQLIRLMLALGKIRETGRNYVITRQKKIIIVVQNQHALWKINSVLSVWRRLPTWSVAYSFSLKKLPDPPSYSILCLSLSCFSILFEFFGTVSRREDARGNQWMQCIWSRVEWILQFGACTLIIHNLYHWFG